MTKEELLVEIINFKLGDEIKVYDTNGELLNIENIAEQVNDDDSRTIVIYLAENNE